MGVLGVEDGAADVGRSLWYPGPLGGAKEANAFSSAPDPLLNFPLGCCDKDGAPTLPDPGPCRGHLSLFDRESPQVAWAPGQDAYFQLSGFTYSPGAPGSTHYGGSCQVGFSVDRGITWKAAASYSGNCPHRERDSSPEAQTFRFKVPRGIPSGDALFAWIWLNREHEVYVNCAKVHIAAQSQTTAVMPTRTGDTPTESVHSYLVSKARDRAGVGDLQATGACDWQSAPIMQTSYFTVDAKCMPGAKLSSPESDNFEYGWDVPCGLTHGDDAFPIRMIDCSARDYRDEGDVY